MPVERRLGHHRFLKLRKKFKSRRNFFCEFLALGFNFELMEMKFLLSLYYFKLIKNIFFVTVESKITMVD